MRFWYGFDKMSDSKLIGTMGIYCATVAAAAETAAVHLFVPHTYLRGYEPRAVLPWPLIRMFISRAGWVHYCNTYLSIYHYIKVSFDTNTLPWEKIWDDMRMTGYAIYESLVNLCPCYYEDYEIFPLGKDIPCNFSMLFEKKFLMILNCRIEMGLPIC